MSVSRPQNFSAAADRVRVKGLFRFDVVLTNRSMADEVQNRPVLIRALSALLEATKQPEGAKILKIESLTIVR
jgi:hypothetical protein